MYYCFITVVLQSVISIIMNGNIGLPWNVYFIYLDVSLDDLCLSVYLMGEIRSPRDSTTIFTFFKNIFMWICWIVMWFYLTENLNPEETWMQTLIFQYFVSISSTTKVDMTNTKDKPQCNVIGRQIRSIHNIERFVSLYRNAIILYKI